MGKPNKTIDLSSFCNGVRPSKPVASFGKHLDLIKTLGQPKNSSNSYSRLGCDDYGRNFTERGLPGANAQKGFLKTSSKLNLKQKSIDMASPKKNNYGLFGPKFSVGTSNKKLATIDRTLEEDS
jgi:hypothetical protein